MNRVIFHIDMDAFYASVEQMDNPALRGKPVIVGGTSKRGVVCAASYEARKFGVHSAMPIFQAEKKCPKGIFLPVKMARYREVSKQIMSILRGFSPLVQQISIDEAYMDISGVDRLLGTPEGIGRHIKQGIREATSLTCSIGIAPNKFLAKIASDLEKPDGLKVIHPEEVQEFIEKLPIERVPGVGGKSALSLHKMGIQTLGDVKRVPQSLLKRKTGKFGNRLLELSKGVDASAVVPSAQAKSISSEETLAVNTNDVEVLKKELLVQSEIVGRRARDRGVKGTTVTLKLKRANFKQMTRSVTLDQATNSTNTIYEQGVKLLQRVKRSAKFRLIGVGLSNLVTSEAFPMQLDLFQATGTKANTWEEAEKAMDAIKEKFGRDAIQRGGLLEDP